MIIQPLPKRILSCRKKTLDLSQPQVMGILNVTPDSFSDGGRYQHLSQAIAQAERLIAEGASILDIGGESTRPNAPEVSLDEELQRVLPIVEHLRDYPVILSIDTSQPEVIRQAVALGADLWNDVRALTRPQAVETAVELDIPVVIMHHRGEPSTMNQLAQYDCVVDDVKFELQQLLARAIQAGLKTEHIIIDMGFGFAKNTQHNLLLLNHLHEFSTMGYPMLVGVSRKRFIGDVLNIAQADERVQGSVIAHLLAVQQGASIVRTHDVKATVEALKMWQAVIQIES